MSEQHPDKLSERDSRLMDSLLKQALHPDNAENELRVELLMKQIREPAVSLVQPSVHQRRNRMPWIRVSLAAALLVAIMLVILPNGSQNAAMAAVERSILAEQRPEAREYEVTIVMRGALGQRRTVTHTLFVRQRKFAIRATPRLGSGEVWIGGSDEQRWFVPRYGPVQVGKEALLNRLQSKHPLVETPFLTVSTMLDRIKRFYDLELTPEVQLIEANTSVMCDHIVGTQIRGTRFAIPEYVELWTDVKTRFARRIKLRWNNPEARWLEATVQLIGTKDLPDDFFDHTSHHEADRAVNRVSE